MWHVIWRRQANNFTFISRYMAYLTAFARSCFIADDRPRASIATAQAIFYNVIFLNFYCCWSYHKTDGARLFVLHSDYVVPWLKFQHSSFTLLLTFHPRDNISECRTHKHAPSVQCTVISYSDSPDFLKINIDWLNLAHINKSRPMQMQRCAGGWDDLNVINCIRAWSVLAKMHCLSSVYGN